ncbi:MAG: aminotransferase class IV, partial [Chloroflexia bacterium]|nr:aminotransferase class IV [Chloroflexia bacterium]
SNESREDTYIRPLAYSAETTGKRFAQIGMEADILINTHPMACHLKTGLTQTAKVSSWRRISDDVMPPRIKNLSNYRNGQLASQEARLDGYSTAILLNPRGTVAEAPGACVMFVRDGKLIVTERQVDRTELYLADEVFTCGTAAEITPIVSIDKYDVGTGKAGTMTTALEAAFYDVLHGREHRFAAWRTPIGVAEALSV